MKKIVIPFLTALGLLILFSCEKESASNSTASIKDVGIRVSFQGNKSASALKTAIALTKETPTNYYVALKSVRLLGTNGTATAVLFNKQNLSSSMVYDFTNSTTIHSLLNGSTIPKGSYSAIEIEVYYLQMNIAIATTTRGKERRNFRIYLSDDAETEGGLHQPGDMTQINNSQEIGWLMGGTVLPNMDPGTPRIAVYSHDGNGANWFNFAGKSGKDFGPFGNVEFFKNAPHPIFKTKADFNLAEGKGSQLIVDLNVNNCWQFEDKSGDGVFGPQDIDPVNPTGWEMVLPAVTVIQN